MILRPGQCNILKFTLNSNNGNVSEIKNGVLDFIQSIDIYESIFTPYILLDLVLVDGANLIEKNQLSGDEQLLIEYQGYAETEPSVYELYLVEIKGIVVSDNLRGRSISLRFASKEYIYNSTQSISKSYDTSLENIVADVYKNYLKSKKAVTVEKSKQFPLVVIPFLNPFTSLSFLRKRAVSIDNSTSPFLVFENRKGHNFVSVDYLYKNRGSSLPTFVQRQGISSNIKGNEASITDFDAHKLFNNFTVKTPVDLAHLLDEGGLNSVVSDFDITTKQYRRRLFSNKPLNTQFTTFASGGTQLSDKVVKNYSSFVGKGFFLPFASYKDTQNKTSNFLFDSLAEKTSFTNLFTQQKVYIDVPGNNNILAGSIINLEVPRHNALNDKKDKNEEQSGNYLVSSVKHTITNSTDAKFSTHLELIRYGKGVFET